MRITAFIMLVLATHLSAKTVSQTVSFKGKNVPFTKVVAEIKQQTGFAIAYNPDVIAKARPVTIDVKDVPLKDFLEQIVVNQPFGFLLEGNTIFISPKATTAELSPGNSAKKDPPVTGIVRGPDGQPLAGVNVVIKGTKKGTVTDKDGRFTIEADEGSVLEISSIGFGKKEVRVNGSQELIVALDITSSVLDEVQYIAYGQTSKRFSVGNISSVKATDIEKQPVSNPLLALQGRVPGLFITQNTGVPGGGITVRIQGLNSIQLGSDPLYVIDGVPFYSQIPASGFDNILGNSGGVAVNGSYPTSNPLNFISPGDIESIDVLKDADATAIYGSRAANGAILITTKKGKTGLPNLKLNMQQGWGRVARKFKVLNTRQYLDMRYEAFRNDGIDWKDPSVSANDLKVWDTTRNTDWQKELIGGTAYYSKVNATLSGGANPFQYILSGTYHRESSVFPGDFSDQRAAINFRINANSPNNKLAFQLSTNYSWDKNKLPNSDLTENAIILVPNAPILYNQDGSLNWGPDGSGTSTWNNPIRYIHQPYEIRSNNLISNGVLSFKPFRGFELKTNFGYTNTQLTDFTSTPLIVLRPEDRTSSNARNASYGNRNLNSWIIEPQANYTQSFFRTRLDVLLGSTFQRTNTTGSYISGSGYTSDLVLKDISSAASLSSFNSLAFIYKYSAAFARVNVNRDDKYILNITGRRDGSSRFGSKNQFHSFGSIGAAWIITQETLFKKLNPVLSFGKLRGSYGTTGSDQIGDYRFMNLYRPLSVGIPYQNITAIRPTGLPNPYLQWEETTKFQYGFDLGFFKDNLLISFTYVKNNSSNQLLNYVLPPFVGFDGILDNFPAKIRNIAYELSINTVNVRSKTFLWEANLNFTIPRNKVVSFPGIENTSYASGTNGIIVGEPIGVLKAFEFAGLDPVTGNYQFKDRNGKVTSEPDLTNDWIALLNRTPKIYGGLENKFTYKGFQLHFLFQYVKQTGIGYTFLNPRGAFPGQNFGEFSNQPATVLNRWQKEGDAAAIRKFTTQPDLNMYVAAASDYIFSDAGFVRLKNLSLSYQLPTSFRRRIGMKDVRVYLQGQNLLTITDYNGVDPESQSISSLPPLRVWTLGIQAEL